MGKKIFPYFIVSFLFSFPFNESKRWWFSPVTRHHQQLAKSWKKKLNHVLFSCFLIFFLAALFPLSDPKCHRDIFSAFWIFLIFAFSMEFSLRSFEWNGRRKRIIFHQIKSLWPRIATPDAVDTKTPIIIKDDEIHQERRSGMSWKLWGIRLRRRAKTNIST